MHDQRFVAFDSWRGIAACFVALYHVQAYSHIETLPLVRNAFLFVDFFFVLSGFVIAATYEERLAGGLGVGRFMLLRFGRLYPLHFVMLMLFVALYLLRGWPLTPEYSAEAVVGNLLLIHSLDIFGNLTWNMPSWSISTEFFAYLCFACAVSVFRQRLLAVIALVVAISPCTLFILKGHINATYDYGLIRCLFGFGAGVIAWRAYRRWRGTLPAGSAAEILTATLALGFVALAGESAWSLAAPLFFAAVVVVFAAERGVASRVLQSALFTYLGLISYSIYMVHFLVARGMLDLVTLASRIGVPGTELLGASRWAGDVAVLAYLALVIGISTITYRLVEAPGRQAFRRLAARMPLRRSAEIA